MSQHRDEYRLQSSLLLIQFALRQQAAFQKFEQVADLLSDPICGVESDTIEPL